MDLLERLHEKRFRAYSTKRSYGTFEKRPSLPTPAPDERNAARAAAAAAPRCPRGFEMVRRVDFPEVDWGEVMSEHFPALEAKMESLPHGNPGVMEEVKAKINEVRPWHVVARCVAASVW
jgi:hypothetical protein